MNEDVLSSNIDFVPLIDKVPWVIKPIEKYNKGLSADILLTDKLNCHSITTEWVERTIRDK